MPATPWAHRWNVLALTILAQALIVGIQTYAFSFWVVPWAEEFSAPRSELMLIITISVVGGGVLSPLAGIALDRYHARTLFSIGLAVFVLGLGLISIAGSHWIIFLIYGAVLPIGLVFCGQLACQTLVARWFSENRGMALGLSALGVSLGAFLIPPIVTALLAAYGWRSAFQLLAAGALLLLAPTGWLTLSREPEARAKPAPDLGSGPRTSWTTGALLRNRDFWIIAGSFGAILMAFLPVLYSLGAYAHDIGIAPQRAAYAGSLAAIALASGKLGFGRLADLASHRLLYRIATLIMVLGIAIVSLLPTFTGLLLGLALASFGQGSYLPLQSSMVVNRFGAPAFGQVMGLATIFIQSTAIAPYLCGLIRDFTGNYTAAFLIMMTPLFAAMVAMQWLSGELREPKPLPKPQLQS